MRVSDLDIEYSAHLFLQLHGDAAFAKAREKVQALTRKGDDEAADTWRRMVAAIATLARRQPMRSWRRG
jgi:hypothetical protein